MPHRCLECKSVLESKDLDLTVGCPVCGNKRFEYVRPPKKEPADADPRKMTVSQYVAYADSVEPKPAEKPHHREAPKHHAAKLESKPELKHEAKPEPKKEKKPEKKASHEPRIDSVRIVEKGSYDLNLPMLLNRKELVMSKEEGVYVVDLPSALKAEPKKKKR